MVGGSTPESPFHNRLLYTLADREPVSCPDVLTWGYWMRDHRADCQVGLTYVGELAVSTLFLGVDMAMFGGGPLLFETIVFRGETNLHQMRCGIWTEAEGMHLAGQVWAAELLKQKPKGCG